MSDIPVITVDGPSGSGKGPLAERLAAHFGFHLLDSGALYRVVAAMAMERGVPLDAPDALAGLARSLDIHFAADGVHVDGRHLEARIRDETVGEGASQVAALPEVREAIHDLQLAQRRPPGLVADGRDMGTVVFPDATLKIFLDASVQARAERRYNQLKNKGLDVNLRALLASLQERDERDRGRAVSPLEPAKDAHVIDSTALDIDAVVALSLQLAAEVGLGKPH